MNSPPIACTLTDPDQRRRQEALQRKLRAGVLERAELEDGYALRFPGEACWVEDLARLVVMERACCPFLRLELVAEPEEGPVWLRLRGPEGTKAFLARSFALCGEAGPRAE